MLIITNFKHSTVTNPVADDSPTVQLVRYLIERYHESGVDAYKALQHGLAFLATAEDMVEDDDDVNRAILEQAGPAIEDLHAVIPRTRQLHSLVINWSDDDPEQGTFGTSVRAWDHEHADFLARSEMETCDDAGYDFTGSVVDHNVGATWKAAELEDALRNLLAWTDSMFRSTSDPDPIKNARDLIAEIDEL